MEDKNLCVKPQPEKTVMKNIQYHTKMMNKIIRELTVISNHIYKVVEKDEERKDFEPHCMIDELERQSNCMDTIYDQVMFIKRKLGIEEVN